MGVVSDRGAKAAQRFAQMLFDEGATAAGCVVLDSARAHTSPDNVELVNQISYFGRRCAQPNDRAAASPDSALVAAPDSAAPRKPGQAPARAPAKTAPATPKAGPAADRRWSVQVAAYVGRGDALRLEARLKARGYDARIVGDKPYRVRIGRFVSRDSAAVIAKKLTENKTTAMIVEAERP